MPFTILLVLASGIVACRPAAGQSTSDNAADVYREAFALMQRMSAEDAELLMNYRDGATALTPEVRAALSRAAPAVRLYQRAAAMDDLDWGIDYTQGPATLLPHLAPMRRGAQLLATAAQARLEFGDTRTAAQLFAATYRMSDQVTDDPVLINSLVGLAINTFVNNRLDQAIQHGHIGQAESAIILEAALPVASADDPLGLVAAMQGERDSFSMWLQDNYLGEGGMERFIEEMAPLFGIGNSEVEMAMADMSQNSFDSAILSYDLALQHAVAAVSQEDLGAAREEMARISADAEAGLYGPLAPMILPALDKALESFIRTYQRLDSTIEKLEELKNDPAAQARLRNAAHWYLRAIAQWNALPEPTRLTILSATEDEQQEPRSDGEAAAPTRRTDEELATALQEAQPIIELVLEASEIERCDFDIEKMWKYYGLNLKLPHLAGMIDLARLMSADTMRLYSQGRNNSQAGAARDIAAIFRMANHLGMDGQLRSTRAAVDIAAIATKQADEANRTALAEPELSEIRRAIGLLSQSRFGLGRAAHEYPALTIDWLIERGGGNLTGAHYQEFFQSSGSDEDNAPFIATVDAIDVKTRAAALTALQPLLRECCTAIARMGDFTDECTAARETYNRAHPPVFADWLLDPLEATARDVEDAVRRLANLQ